MFKDCFKKIRQNCWALIDREYSERKNRSEYARDLLLDSIKDTKKTTITVLDVGCGHRSEIYIQNSNIIYAGVDMVFDSVKRNKDINYGFIGDLATIPLKNNSVDIIVSSMVFEHLIKPESAFSEFSRILRVNGSLIFITPSIYGVVTIINRFLPDKISQRLSHVLTGVNELDVFPTVYRANSIRKLRKLLGIYNILEEKLIMYQPPPYAFVFSESICRLIIWYYHIINKFDLLKSLRGVIIARYRKKEE